MKYLVSSFGESFSILRKDKIVLLFSFAPILIGVVLYYFLGQLIFTDFLDWINIWVKQKVSSDGLGSVISWIVTASLTVVMYFIVSWTFVLIVSLIASPFNDIISNRTEKILMGEVPESLDKSIGRLLKRFAFTIVNELKKISFIVIMTFLALILNFIPILSPVSFVLSALLFAIGFVDYSWSRHNLHFRECVSSTRRLFLGFSLSGCVFLGLVAIPVVNLFTLPYAVIYYTIFFTKNRMVSDV